MLGPISAVGVNKLIQIDRNTLEVVETFVVPGPTGQNFSGLTSDAATELFYVHDWSTGTVKVFRIPKLEVPVDIKPQSCPNHLNVGSKSVLLIAILGNDDFDVTQIDPESIRLEDVVAPLRWTLEYVATPFEPFVGKWDCEDCNELGPDDYMDLTLKFDKQAVVAVLGKVQDGDCLVLTLTGNLQEEFGGTPIVGEDVVVFRTGQGLLSYVPHSHISLLWAEYQHIWRLLFLPMYLERQKQERYQYQLAFYQYQLIRTIFSGGEFWPFFAQPYWYQPYFHYWSFTS
ncbi:MAG: hypothetical protein JSV09_04605 [Thermoplasmata archaeon]|nr:MAG: hypothetical protein JSV09_04605 [Thermoplasmata archaeon]